MTGCCVLKDYARDDKQCPSDFDKVCGWCGKKVCFYHRRVYHEDGDCDRIVIVCVECLANASETTINTLNQDAELYLSLEEFVHLKSIYCPCIKRAKA